MGTIGNMLIAALLIALVATGMGIFIGGLGDTYPSTATGIDEDNFTVFDYSDNISEKADAIASKLQDQGTGSASILDVPYIIITGGYEAVMMVFTAGDYLIALVSAFGIVLAGVGINVQWAIGFIIVIIVVGVTLAILNTVLNKKEV